MERSSNIKSDDYIAFDIIKGLAVLGMPLVHVLEEFTEGTDTRFLADEVYEFEDVIYCLPILGPSVFLLVMGICMAGPCGWKAIRKNGVQFLLLSLVLNVLRTFIPLVFSSLILKDLPYFLGSLKYMYEPDIYTFVGLFLILLSVFKKANLSDASILAISVLMNGAGYLTAGMAATGVPEIDLLLGNFIYVDEESYFPLVSWFIFPAVGYAFGNIFKKSTDKAALMKKVLVVSAAGYAAATLILLLLGIDPILVQASQLTDEPVGLLNILMLTLLFGIIVGILFFIYHRTAPGFVTSFLIKISAAIMPFYIIHWIIIGWALETMTAFKVPDGVISFPGYLAVSLGITVFTAFVSIKWGATITRFLLKITNPKFKSKGEKQNA